MSEVSLHLGDCLEVMPTMAADTFDALVTDPPYGLGFMGKDWDHGIPGVRFWQEALRVAKPGAHLLAFGGTRTFHRLAVAIEDAGWEIRDTVMWVYGSGFPKSHNVGKAIDKAAGAEREVVGAHPYATRGTAQSKQSVNLSGSPEREQFITAPATPEAQRWDGWGTALKPAWEPIIVARKPFRGTVAANVLEWGTGAINVDGCRVGTDAITTNGWATNGQSVYGNGKGLPSPDYRGAEHAGRWPANLIHDGSDEVVGLFPETTSGGGVRRYNGSGVFDDRPSQNGKIWNGTTDGDSGSAARFFYCAKASRADRDEGCEGLEEKPSYMVENGSKTSGKNGQRYERTTVNRNHHPTVKPTDLMRYLCRLVTPPGGVVLDPFMGSGSTGKGAVLEGFDFVGIEQDAEYLEIARRRIAAVELPLFAEGS